MQPVVLEAEYDAFVEIVKADAALAGGDAQARHQRFQTTCRSMTGRWARSRRGTGHGGCCAPSRYFEGHGTNFYGRPIEGVVALVDMNAESVVEFIDTGDRAAAAAEPGVRREIHGRADGAEARSRSRSPTAPSFTINGQEIRWQKWRFRYTMHPREGLVLHTVGYEDDGRVRPILYRASLSEMAVPYGDRDQNWRWRSAFDVGEYGMGRLASSIEPDTDAPPNATLLPRLFADDDGEAVQAGATPSASTSATAACCGSTTNRISKTNESRRARQLVIFFIATIGNYDYAINWVFHQDGALELDAALTGIMLPKGVKETNAAGHATSRSVRASRRGQRRRAASSALLQLQARLRRGRPGERGARDEHARAAGRTGQSGAQRDGHGGDASSRTEALAQRRHEHGGGAARGRSSIRRRQNALGHHTSYILVPGVNSIPYVAPDSPVRQRAGFINQHFWATRYNADEMYAAGPYPNQSLGGAGLPKWVANNEPLSNQDVVVWYTMGITHIPRPEEWPVMPVTHVGFRMIPGGFFSRNPALDVPAARRLTVSYNAHTTGAAP